MNKGWIIALISVGAVGAVYLYYRSQKKAKALITIPALAPLVTPTPNWLEALKAVVAGVPAPTETEAIRTVAVPPLRMPSPPLVAPTLTPEEKGLAEELGISEYAVRKFKQVM